MLGMRPTLKRKTLAVGPTSVHTTPPSTARTTRDVLNSLRTPFDLDVVQLTTGSGGAQYPSCPPLAG